MGIFEKLAKIQQEMKAPKNLFNKFGGYKYRNAEGILEAFKPFESKYNVCLTIGDEIVEIGGRVYVKSTAILRDCELSGFVENTAYAREDPDKKGMDGAQITGAASSYARKYALNGLFLLDDTKDPDTEEYKKQQEREPEPEFLTVEQKTKITAELVRTGISRKSLLQSYHVESLDDLTTREAAEIIKKLAKSPDYKKA